MVVEGWLERAAATQPARTAIETPQGNRSYTELLADARVGAGQLSSRGAGPGVRVAIALPAGLDFVRTLHACLLIGAVAVPLDLRLSAPERERIVAGCGVLVEEPLDTAASVSRGTPVSAPVDTTVVNPPIESAGATHDLDATAVVIHTSGTTAVPRPVELTYGNFLWSAIGSAVALGLDPRERWLCALPLAHVGGLSILLRSAIYGTTAVVHERFETERVLLALREQRITLVSLVATTLARLLDAGLERPPHLRCALTGGGPVPAALLRRAHEAGVPVSQTYGLTESCSQATTTPVAAIGRDRAVDTGWAGTPIFCTHVQIAADGEILLRGPTVAPAARDAEGWLHTGDLGSRDELGRLRVSGRAADTIISGGENVAPSEIEAVLEAHPSVLEAAVIGRPDPRWGEVIIAVVIARPGVDLQAEALRKYCAASLAPFKVPKQIVLADEPLPRTRSGKLLRRELV